MHWKTLQWDHNYQTILPLKVRSESKLLATHCTLQYFDDDLSNRNPPPYFYRRRSREITELKTKRSKSQNCDWEKRLETPITGSTLKMQFLSIDLHTWLILFSTKDSLWVLTYRRTFYDLLNFLGYLRTFLRTFHDKPKCANLRVQIKGCKPKGANLRVQT